MHHARATHPHRTMPATKRTWPALAGCCALAVLVLGPWETVTPWDGTWRTSAPRAATLTAETPPQGMAGTASGDALGTAVADAVGEASSRPSRDASGLISSDATGNTSGTASGDEALSGQPTPHGIISEEVNVSERQPVRLVPHGPLVRGATPGTPGTPGTGGVNGADGTPDADGAPHANSVHGVHGVDDVGGASGVHAAPASARVPATSADVAPGHAKTTTFPDTADTLTKTGVPQRPDTPIPADAQSAHGGPAPSASVHTIPHTVDGVTRGVPSGAESGQTAPPAPATRYGTTSGTVHSITSPSQHATASVSEHATASVSEHATAPASQHATAAGTQHATTSENLLDSMDVYALSPHAARLALPRMVPVVVAERLRVSRPAFPFWESAIDKASRTHALDPRLIAAVIRAESGYDPGAVSPRGAQGVMQIMPATQRELGLDDPFDPEANVEAGSRYLKQQLDRFGTLELALAAYNAGPGNVLKYGGVPPFDETRTFVRRVLDGMR